MNDEMILPPSTVQCWIAQFLTSIILDVKSGVINIFFLFPEFLYEKGWHNWLSKISQSTIGKEYVKGSK